MRAPALLLALLVAVGAARDAGAATAITVEQAWSRATAGTDAAAVYLTVRNAGPEEDRLTGAATPVAKRAILHASMDHGGTMMMHPLPDGVPVPAGGSATLAPGGTHLMLMELDKPLAAGSSFPLTLDFARAGKVDVTVKVMSPGAKSPAG